MSGCIAVVNAGSSSIKVAVYGPSEDLMFRGQLEQIGVSPRLKIQDGAGQTAAEQNWPAEGFDHRRATHELLNATAGLVRAAGASVSAVGHRVVHGGTRYEAPVRVDEALLNSLATLIPLAPLHQPNNLAAITAIAEIAPRLPQVACFDTAFHRRQPPIAQSFALPRRFSDAGVRRYGFHGLSYEFVVGSLQQSAPELAAGRLIIAHLGNGASLCAVKDGRSMASTMGFTAVDGLMMGTRCGAVDPGVLIHLMDAYGMDARALEDLIYRRSGLLGVSGVSSDMRVLRASADPNAREAVELFVYRIVREIGSLAAALGGLDGLIFTGGIGENDAATRSEVAAGCDWLGVCLDDALNLGGEGRIGAASSAVDVRVVRTDEERMIQRHTRAVLVPA